MTDDEIMGKLTNILRGIFEDNNLHVTRQTNAKTVPGWDSMAQVKVLIAVEEEFGIKFSSREMDNLRNVGDLANSVARRKRH